MQSSPLSVLPALGANIAATSVVGNNSFTMPDPNTMDRNYPVRMSPDMFRATFDERYRREHPADAALRSYRHRFQPEVSTGYRIGEEIGRPLLQGGMGNLHKLFSTGAVPASLMSALALGGGGWLAAKLYNSLPFVENKLDAGRVGSLGAVAGGLTGLIGGGLASAAKRPGMPPQANNFQSRYADPNEFYDQIDRYIGQGKYASLVKRAAWRTYGSSGDPYSDYGAGFAQAKAEVNSIINTLRNLSGHEQGELQNAIERLYQRDPAAVAELRRKLGMAAGATAGAIISNFLIGKGIIPTLIGALLGGAAGSKLFSSNIPRPTTIFGQPLGGLF
jgi:hypothetical protein